MPIDSRNAGLRNERLVLALLRQHGQLSQAQLCKLAGINSSTASYIVGRLREKRLISEQRGESRRPGAKPVIVSIRPGAQLVAGVEIGPTSALVGLFDFHGRLVESRRSAIRGRHSPAAVVDLVEAGVRELLSGNRAAEERLLGIGLTVSGAISPDGVVRLSAPMAWENVPLQGMVQERFRAPVHLFSTKVRILAELSLVPAKAAQNLVLLNFADGVGASLAENGRLVLGASGRAGEIGHVIFDPKGPRCGCGHRGCLETFASGPALARRIRRDIRAGRRTMLRELVRPDDPPRTVLDHLGRGMAQGDAYAVAVRDQLAGYVSRATAIAINCYDPDVVVLAGYVVAQCAEHLIQAAQQRFASDVFDDRSRAVQIVAARAGDEALIRGVATAILNHSMQLH